MRSEVFEQMHRQWKTFHHLFQLLLLAFVVERNQFDPLEHIVAI